MSAPLPIRGFSRLLGLSLLAFTLAPPSGAQQSKPQQEEETVKLESELVVVTATITGRDGSFVRGLTPSDFVLFENGRPQPIATFGDEKTPFAMAIIIDSSGSMEPKLSLARAAAAEFSDKLRPDDVLSFWAFSNEIKRISDFTKDHNLPESVWDLETSGQTRMYDCVMEALTALSKRPEKRRALILISDGIDNYSMSSAQDVINRALQFGVTSYCIDLMTDVPTGESRAAIDLGGLALKSIAQKTGGRYLKSPGGILLDDAFGKIVDDLGSQYILSFYAPAGAVPGQWRKIKVQPKNTELQVRSRDGYTIPKPSKK